MRVPTMHIFGRRGDRPSRRELLREEFSRLSPDLVAFQEAVVHDRHDRGVWASDRFGLAAAAVAVARFHLAERS
jgi:hypothetical protein